MKLNLKHISLIIFVSLVYSCIEPFDFKTTSFESALVVEASITNELKTQVIKLSRTYKLEDSAITDETGATILVTDDQGNTFNFNELSPGQYSSSVPFTAVQNRNYQLMIKTSDNRTYTSNNQQIKSSIPLQNVTAQATTTNVGGIEKEGISIIAESYDSSRNSNFYRYEYEETYKIISPFWSTQELEVVLRVLPFKVRLINRTKEEKTCYATNLSNEIIQTETATLSEDRVNFPVKFIDRSDFTIRNRYSILVKQYIQSIEAYTFYKILNELSSSESLFSQTQPGTLIGNIVSNENENESVLGFFEVSSVSSKRIFFNFSDFYQGDIPEHIDDCEIIAPLLVDRTTSPLIHDLDAGRYIYFMENPFTEVHLVGPYLLVPKSCGDCTVLGSNVKPNFWID